MTNLKNGSSGSDVLALQKALNSKGYNLDEDGAYGNQTEAAVRDYQSKNGLAVDGVVGTNTWGSLNSSTGTTTTTDEYGLVKPTYTSKYQGNIDSLVDQITNREKFTYDAGADPIYQQYRDQYTALGDKAAKNAAAQTATLSGGYANSYATTAAAQANQSYLSQLNSIIPTLESNAYTRYQNEGTDLQNKLSMYQGLENTDYNRYQNELSQYNTDRSAAISKASSSSKSSSSSKGDSVDDEPTQYDYFLAASSAIADSDNVSSKQGIDYADDLYDEGYINMAQRNALYDQARGKARTAYYKNLKSK